MWFTSSSSLSKLIFVLVVKCALCHVCTSDAKTVGKRSINRRVYDESINHPPKVSVNTLSADGTITVAENSEPYTFVAHISVNDVDAGANGKIDCTVNNIYFDIETLYESEYKIFTTRPFDREERDAYSFTLLCHDYGNPPNNVVETLQVKIADVNDNLPICVKSKTTIEVLETEVADTTIGTVHAVDYDIGPNGLLVYSMSENHFEYPVITINETTGVLKTLVDFRGMGNLALTFNVTVSDMGYPTLKTKCEVVVNVIDQYEDLPSFQRDQYSFQVQENTMIGTIVCQIQVQYSQKEYNYSIAGDIVEFSVNEKTGIIFTNVILDRETVPMYNLRLTATGITDPDESTSTQVQVFVLDVNDNIPKWTISTIQNRSISKEAPVGYAITTLHAVDKDTGPNSEVRYVIASIGINRANHFTVNSRSGNLTVAKSLANIDEEMGELVVFAIDNGSPRLVALAKFEINIFE